MRTKPTDNHAKTETMKHLHFLLLTLASSPAFSSELRIDPARLQDQVQQRSEQAAQQGAAPSAPAAWLIEPTPPAQGYGQGGMGHGAAARQGYGQGYERRYGQASERSETGSFASPGGMGSGQGGMGAGRRGGGRH